MALYLFLLGLASPLTQVSQHPPEENHSPQEIFVAELQNLTIVNLGETYQSLPSRNLAGGHPRSQLILKVGIRLKNISSDHVMTLDTDCFRMVGKLVFPEPLVGPVEAPDDFPSTPDSLAGHCRDFPLNHKLVRVMPGKSYEAITQLKFEVVDGVAADPPQSVNPGVYFLQARIAITQNWIVDKQEQRGQVTPWNSGPVDTEPMKFTVKGKSKRRQV